ncbi:hypothetical protein COV56_03125 [Candidatus Kuenenbacteria bacterium CG11_big_fil_rev_8_21_14_0_20_37_9]|nr:MAG: hypothetical protein COV56_03125 [Candidatus Kuenenbacteria bacterium CG11_big_fil_rev_8_21_14_0_20_37_9]
MDKDRKKKIIILFFFALFSVSIVAIAFFVLCNKKSNHKTLIDYSPKNAIFFLEINLSGKNLKNFLNKGNATETVLEKFLIDNDFPRELWQAKEKIEKAALIEIPSEKNGYRSEKAWLVKSLNDVRELETLPLHNLYFSIIDKNTAIFSLSLYALNVLSETHAQDIKIESHDFVRDNNNFIYGYFKNEYVKNFLSKESINYELMKNSKAVFREENIYWKINLMHNKIFFDIEVPLSSADELDNKDDANVQELAPLNNAIVINKFNLSTLIDILKAGLANQSDNSWEYLEKYLEAKYKVRLSELYTFFDQPAILVVQPKNIITSLADALAIGNYYYTLVLEKSASNNDEALLYSIETFIQNYLAFKYPSSKEIVLPDKTIGKELVADVKDFVFEENSDYKNLRTIKKNDFEFNYLNNENIISAGNNHKLLEMVLQSFFSTESKNGISYDMSFDFRIIDSQWTNSLGIGLFTNNVLSDKLYIHGEVSLNI